MFKTFLANHSLSDYHFDEKLFPTVSDREFWNRFPNNRCVELAEKAISYEWPVIKATDFMEYKKSGNRKIMENPHFDRRYHLVLFALAELKENKGRFLPQIINGLFAICEETYWGLSAHLPNRYYFAENLPSPAEPYIDLFAAETAEHLSMIVYLLEEPLRESCPEILERVAYELETRIKMPYFIHRDYKWMGYHERCNNWNPWILSNLLTVFLLTESNEIRFRRALQKMFEEIQHYYNGQPADGGCDEGPGYWERAGASLFEFLYQLKEATCGKLDLFEDDKIRKIAAYPMKVHIAEDYFVNVADAHAKGMATLSFLLFGFAEQTGQVDLMNFAAALYGAKGERCNPCNHTLLTIRRLIYHAEFFEKIKKYPVKFPLHGEREYLPDMELAALRQGDLFLCAKGGFNQESHNHNDVGSFVFYDGATPVLIDVGINTYTRFTFDNRYRYTLIPWVKSSYHNLPVINGAEQSYGEQFRAADFSVAEKQITVSFADAYPSKAGLKSLTRDLTIHDKGMRCTDRFSFVAEDRKAVTEVLMSILPVREEEGAAIIGERYCVKAEHGSLRTEFVPFEDAPLQLDWKAEGVTRILFCVDGNDSVTITVEKI